MRRAALTAVLIATASCVPTPPAEPTPHSAIDIGASFGRTWDAVIDEFARSNIPIKAIDRSSGLIATDALTVGPSLAESADCGKDAIAGTVYPTNATYNALVRGDSSHATLRITVRWMRIGKSRELANTARSPRARRRGRGFTTYRCGCATEACLAVVRSRSRRRRGGDAHNSGLGRRLEGSFDRAANPIAARPAPEWQLKNENDHGLGLCTAHRVSCRRSPGSTTLATALTLEWSALHREELMANWERCAKEPGDVDSSAGLRAPVPWHVVDVRAAGGHRLFVTFADGTRGEVHLSRLVASENAGVFAKLRDPAVFARVGVAHGAVTWPNGVDLAPDAMYDEIKAGSRWVL